MNILEATYASRGLKPIPPQFTGRVPPGNAYGCIWWWAFERSEKPKAEQWSELLTKYAERY